MLESPKNREKVTYAFLIALARMDGLFNDESSSIVMDSSLTCGRRPDRQSEG